ncbi:hypothetical protein ACOXVJ_24645 [Pseudomonas knackmussii]|uniref:hypothetical protein n=1 Tax=Pseudomonas knackmussii TaxID=65741 RepID=UPI003BC218F3
MFLTHQQARVMDAGLFGDVIAWRYVEHSIHRPWLYVATLEKNEDFDLRPMLMVSDVQLLQALLADQEQGLRVESVLLVTPHHMNQSGRWMMEPLDSIEKHETPGGVAYVYAVQGGRFYIEGNPEIPNHKDAKQKAVFRTDMLYPRAASKI